MASKTTAAAANSPLGERRDDHPLACFENQSDTPASAHSCSASARGAYAAASATSLTVMSPQPVASPISATISAPAVMLPPPVLSAANCMPSWPELAAVLSNLDVHLRAHVPGDIHRPSPYHSSVMPPTPLVHFAHFVCARTRYDVAGL
eukprot:CAMPEP_0174836446 /NCGR_PEP_ID=MMETSP1114-20130205/6089_1 /TAXON_ID=312471 /ORGANISM="Neobodo designis, Strain CCAP 1951/1" /LENGTH=148 /DNA_ID=CAMNT_0016070447 /DNA_START=21 /DNA_END=464 /DNA_ORIENTATION=-